MRVIAALVLAAAAVFFATSVRRVEFSGDMEPTFDFRWTPDRMAVLEEHRTQRASEQGETPIADLSHVEIGPYDVLEYRGPHRDGIVPGPPLRAIGRGSRRNDSGANRLAAATRRFWLSGRRW